MLSLGIVRLLRCFSPVGLIRLQHRETYCSLQCRIFAKQTAQQDIDEGSDYESLGRAQSAPGRVDCDTPRSMISEADHLAHQTAQSGVVTVWSM